MNIQDAAFTVVDVETTGLDPEVDRVVEYATVPVYGGNVYWTDAYSELFNPGFPIPPGASAIHHIVDEDVEGRRTCADRVILESGPFVAHNAAFDSKFLTQIKEPMICTMRLAKKLWPTLDGYSNQFLRYHWKLPIPEAVKDMGMHRALPDAVVTAFLLVSELTELSVQKPEIQSVTDLVEWLAKPILLHKVGFGKHSGSLWSEVPRDYLRWMLGNMADMDDDTRYTAEYYYKGGR